MMDATPPFLAKAQESLAGTESEFAAGRYNNCANRCYYACFQAAIHALIKAGIQPLKAGIQPRGAAGQWGHDFVQAEFASQLINRRKIYPVDMRDVLPHAQTLRHAADYRRDWMTEKQMARNLRRAQSFVEAVLNRQGE